MKLFRNIRINKVKIIIWSLVFLILIVVFHNDYSENYLVKVDNVVKVNKAFVLNIKTDSSNEIQSNIVVSDTSTEIQNNNIIDRTPEYVRSIENILLGQFTPVEQVRSPSTDYMNLGFIMINLNSTTTDLTESFKSKVSRTFYSMLQYWDSLSLNLIVITDQKSVKSAAKFIGSIFMRETSMRLITTKSKRWRLTNQIPKVKVHFVNYEEIVAKNRPFVKKLQSVTAQFKENKTVEDDRYMADLFYIAPIYHLALTGIEKMIVIDATDLEFANNINLLHDQFQHMTNGKLIGLGLDLSPNYYIQLTKYRIFNPDSEVGFPGDTQGFNTGVVLYNLAEMRRSSLYNSYLTPAMVAMLEKKYYYGYTLAEQDWFTSLSYNHPDLFHVLPCKFNRQTSIQFLRPPYEDDFEDFHSCSPKTGVVIFHSNGCGPLPTSCSIDPTSSNYTGTYWKNHTLYMEDPHLEMCGMWSSLAMLPDLIDESACLQYAWSS